MPLYIVTANTASGHHTVAESTELNHLGPISPGVLFCTDSLDGLV
jgi:hypothetical protein